MSTTTTLVPLAEDFCASMVAIAIVCHYVTRSNTMSEYTADSLVAEIVSRFESHRTFSDYLPLALLEKSAEALHHGFKIFKKQLEKRSIDVIKRKHSILGVNMMDAFMELESSTYGYSLRFLLLSSNGDTLDTERPILIGQINNLRDQLLLAKYGKGYQTYDSIEDVVIAYSKWLAERTRTLENNQMPSDLTVARKRPNELSIRQLQNIGDQAASLVMQSSLLHPDSSPGDLAKVLHYASKSTVQVMDLVVNCPLKQYIRTQRAKSIVEHFKEYKRKLNENISLPEGEREKIIFKPKAPTLKQAVTDLILLFENQFVAPKFAAGVNKSFQKVGMIPTDNGSWIEYQEHETTGTMKFIPSGALDDSLFDRIDENGMQHAIIRHVVNNYLDGEENEDDENNDGHFEEDD